MSPLFIVAIFIALVIFYFRDIIAYHLTLRPYLYAANGDNPAEVFWLEKSFVDEINQITQSNTDFTALRQISVWEALTSVTHKTKA